MSFVFINLFRFLLGLSVFGLMSLHLLFAQTSGQVRFQFFSGEKEKKPLAGVKINIKNRKETALSDSLGSAQMTLPAGKYIFIFTEQRHADKELKLTVLPDSVLKVEIKMVPDKEYSLAQVEIVDKDPRTSLPNKDNATDQVIPLKTKDIVYMSSLGGIEKLITLLGGVAQRSEFSTQYQVRGGNFDENLTYINNVEIYRPMVVRSGQQEGLPITNSNLAENVTFNSGGFPAIYGDKLSSVLNIRYRTPNRFHGTAELGLINQNLHLEGSSKNKADSSLPGRFTWLGGVRRFSPSYLLNTLNTAGDYQPNFWDAQALLTWTPKSKRKHFKIVTDKTGAADTIFQPTDPFKISALGIFTYSKFAFFPGTRETTFGTITRAFRLFVAFIGEEQTNYATGQGALTLEYRPSFRFNLKTIFSSVRSVESELTGVEGGYRLGDVNTNLGSEGYNEVVAIRGVGTEIRNARNFLEVDIYALEQRGEFKADRNFHKKLMKKSSYLKHTLHFGWKVQAERIHDFFREWTATDSADFVRMGELISARNTQNTVRFSGFLQHNFRTSRTTNLVYGVRFNHWTLNGQTLITPRVQFVYDPTLRSSRPDTLKRRIQYRAAIGWYAQPPFYRELRNFRGVVNPDVRAQNSIHYILGFDMVFKAWNRDFKLYVEGYYKQLLNIIPYEIDNVRLRYYPEQTGTGFAYGIDTRINGQFIEGVDSWFSFSYLNTQEDVTGDRHGRVPRPADQRIIMSFYFQDEIPKMPSLKAHINFVFNSGMPFGPPQNYDLRTSVFRMPVYHRIDLGVSKTFDLRKKDDDKAKKRLLESVWVGLEVFNLFARENTVSYNWINDVVGQRFAIPNYLSQRLLSLRVIVRV